MRDHFAILKVGPGVTFALREAFWALVEIERELGVAPPESLKEVVLAAMQRDPRHWKAYYTDPRSRAFDLQYSLSDRIRYYWNVPEVARGVRGADREPERPPHSADTAQPVPAAAIRRGPGRARSPTTPRALLLDGVAQVLRDYAARLPSAAGG